jgi:hypothetical protein
MKASRVDKQRHPVDRKNSRPSPLTTMVVFSAALASIGAYLLLSTTQALPTSNRGYTNGHGPSVALYDAMADGDFTGDVTQCKGMSRILWFSRCLHL